MTFPDVEDERLTGPQAPAPRSAGVNPVSEWGEDQARDEVMRELEEQPSRPLSGDEKRAAEADPGRAPTVYAPASQRVSNLRNRCQVIERLWSTWTPRPQNEEQPSADRNSVFYRGHRTYRLAVASRPGDFPAVTAEPADRGLSLCTAKLAVRRDSRTTVLHL
jgi:hypothetical protein